MLNSDAASAPITSPASNHGLAVAGFPTALHSAYYSPATASAPAEPHVPEANGISPQPNHVIMALRTRTLRQDVPRLREIREHRQRGDRDRQPDQDGHANAPNRVG